MYNALGQSVRTLLASDMVAGRHELTWDGRDDRGNGLVQRSVFLPSLRTGPRAQPFACITAARRLVVNYSRAIKKPVGHPANGFFS